MAEQTEKKTRKNEEQVVKELKERKKFLYQVECLKGDAYFNYCYDYIISNEIDMDKKELKGIISVTRDASYNRKKEHMEIEEINNTNRGEEIFVLKLFKEEGNVKSLPFISELLDYQIPLKNKQTDKGYGKIDFAYLDNEKNFCIVEVKAEYSSESILKAIMEVQTYYQQIDKEKLVSDFGAKSDTVIKKKILIFDNTLASRQYKYKKTEKIAKLLDLFDIEVIVLKTSITLNRVN